MLAHIGVKKINQFIVFEFKLFRDVKLYRIIFIYSKRL